MHKKPKSIVKDLLYCVQELELREEDVCLVHAMVLKYLRLREKSDFEAVAVEYEIKDKEVIGYIDLIEKRPNGDWYISDLKTAATFYESKIAELSKDRQAKEYGLDVKKFKGCRYLVTTKSKAKKKAKESEAEFVMRLLESPALKTFAITIPKELMDISGVKDEHLRLRSRAVELFNGVAPEKNFTYCQAYFRPCEYFSQCHGMAYDEFMETNKIIVERL